MLAQLNHWMEFVTAGVDLLLLLRLLGLRLQRTYMFITLISVLSVMFDVVVLLLAKDSPELQRLEIYSELLLSIVAPLAAWDVFEELSSLLGAMRRAAMFRLVQSLLMMIFLGLLITSLAVKSEDQPELAFLSYLGILVGTGSASACLAFIWTMQRVVRAQKTIPPHNTFIWIIYFKLIFVSSVISYFSLLIPWPTGETAHADALRMLELAIGIFTAGLTIWCAAKLRAMPKDMPSESVNENS